MPNAVMDRKEVDRHSQPGSECKVVTVLKLGEILGDGGLMRRWS